MTTIKLSQLIFRASLGSHHTGERVTAWDAAKSRVAEKKETYEVMIPGRLLKEIQQKEQKMLQHARDLEFEQAADLRDEIRSLREQLLHAPA